MEWQPIETAPKDGTSILTYPHYCVTHWESEDCYPEAGWVVAWEDCMEQYITNKIATHWMPLPPPPEAKPND